MNSKNFFIIPYPKEMDLLEGFFHISLNTGIWLDGGNNEKLFPIAKKLREDILSILNIHLAIKAGATEQKDNRIVFICNRNLMEEEYILDINLKEICISYGKPAGAFRAVTTIKQILSQCGKTIPQMHLEDAPDIKNRGVMLDISRDKIPQVSTIYRIIDILADLKFNQLQLYIEGFSFAYESFPEVWKTGTPITGEEILEIDLYCKERFIELVPNQNSFGHMGAWLSREEYKSLGECTEDFAVAEGVMVSPGTFDLFDPVAIELINRQFDDLLPYFTSETLNTGLDEPFELGKGKSKVICEEKGRGEVYLDCLTRIYNLARSKGKRMMFWGDIIVEYPHLIKALPDDIILLEWGYDYDHPFEVDCRKFREAGKEFYVCPGTSTWNSITGRTHNMVENLWNAAKNGMENGTSGFLITDWGDGGHWQYLPASYPGFVCGAAFSWRVDKNQLKDIGNYMDMFIFKDEEGIMGKAVMDLGNYYLLEGEPIQNATKLTFILYQNRHVDEFIEKMDESVLHSIFDYAYELEKRISMTSMKCDDAELITGELLNSIRIIKHGTKLGLLKLSEIGKLPGFDEKAVREMMEDISEIAFMHKKLWLARNKYSGIEDSTWRLSKLKEHYLRVIDTLNGKGDGDDAHN